MNLNIFYLPVNTLFFLKGRGGGGGGEVGVLLIHIELSEQGHEIS